MLIESFLICIIIYIFYFYNSLNYKEETLIENDTCFIKSQLLSYLSVVYTYNHKSIYSKMYDKLFKTTSYKHKDGGYNYYDYPIDFNHKPLLIFTNTIGYKSKCKNFIKYLMVRYKYMMDINSVYINFRGMNDYLTKSDKNMYTHNSYDIYKCIRHIVKKYNIKSKIVLIGFSYGANELTKVAYLALKKLNIGGLVTISNPWCLYTLFCELWGYKKYMIYKYILINHVLNYFKNNGYYDDVNKFKIMLDFIKVDFLITSSSSSNVQHELIKCSTNFYNRFILPHRINKNESFEEYCKNESSINYIEYITKNIPVLIIHSKDDHITPITYNTITKLKTCKKIILTNEGGHVFFMKKTMSSWITEPLTKFILTNIL